MNLLVLAGGFGTRLQSVVAEVPKALAPIGSAPFLFLQIEHWKAQGVRSFVFLLHHKSQVIIDFLLSQQDKLLSDCDLHWLIESAPLGSGGAVANAVNKFDLSESFLVTNADTWLGTGMQAIASAKAPSLAVVRVPDASRFGTVIFDSERRVTNFAEKSSANEDGWIYSGLCKLDPAIFSNWDGQPFSLENEIFPKLAHRKYLNAITLQSDFIDIGIPNDYLRFCRWIESGRRGEL